MGARFNEFLQDLPDRSTVSIGKTEGGGRAGLVVAMTVPGRGQMAATIPGSVDDSDWVRAALDEAAESLDARARSGLRVLVIEDEEVVRELLRRVLASQGCEVRTAPDGATALALVREHRPEVVLCDLHLPDARGADLVASILREHAEAKVIAISGGGWHGGKSVLAEASEAGAVAALEKPFSLANLLRTVRQAASPAKG